MKPSNRFFEKSSLLEFVQCPASLQQRANRNLGSGGTITQGLSPFALKMGVTLSTSLLKISGDETTTLPPRWKVPLLLKGNEVVPSNCSNLTELLPRMSNTNAVACGAMAVVLLHILDMLSGVAVQPGTVTSMIRLLAPSK
jgi:hypothetical protein